MSIIERWYRNLDSHATEEINIHESQSILWRRGSTVRERLCRREDSNQGGHPAGGDTSPTEGSTDTNKGLETWRIRTSHWFLNMFGP